MSHSHPLEGDTIQVNLFHYLCKKGQSVSEKKLLFRIPDTIIFYNHPIVWFYWSESVGEIRKRGGKGLERANILQAFCKRSQAEKEACNIVASFISHTGGEGPDSAQFFNEAELAAFLHDLDEEYGGKTGRVKQGLLQKFVVPKGHHNSMLQAIWSPQLFSVNRRVNRLWLSDKHHSSTEKAITFEGPTHHSEHAQCAAGVKRKVQDVCESFVEHFKGIEHNYSITRMVLYFKEDCRPGFDELWLMFSSSLRIVEQKFAVQKERVPLSLTPHFEGLHYDENHTPRSVKAKREQVAQRKRFQQEGPSIVTDGSPAAQRPSTSMGGRSGRSHTSAPRNPSPSLKARPGSAPIDMSNAMSPSIGRSTLSSHFLATIGERELEAVARAAVKLNHQEMERWNHANAQAKRHLKGLKGQRRALQTDVGLSHEEVQQIQRVAKSATLPRFKPKNARSMGVRQGDTSCLVAGSSSNTRLSVSPPASTGPSPRGGGGAGKPTLPLILPGSPHSATRGGRGFKRHTSEALLRAHNSFNASSAALSIRRTADVVEGSHARLLEERTEACNRLVDVLDDTLYHCYSMASTQSPVGGFSPFDFSLPSILGFLLETYCATQMQDAGIIHKAQADAIANEERHRTLKSRMAMSGSLGPRQLLEAIRPSASSASLEDFSLPSPSLGGKGKGGAYAAESSLELSQSLPFPDPPTNAPPPPLDPEIAEEHRLASRERCGPPNRRGGGSAGGGEGVKTMCEVGMGDSQLFGLWEGRLGLAILDSHPHKETMVSNITRVLRQLRNNLLMEVERAKEVSEGVGEWIRKDMNWGEPTPELANSLSLAGVSFAESQSGADKDSGAGEGGGGTPPLRYLFLEELTSVAELSEQNGSPFAP